MKIYTVNYESLIKNFKSYYDSKEVLKGLQTAYIDTMTKYRSEMESLMKSSQSLLLDESTQSMNQQRFMTLQKDAMEVEKKLRAEIQKTQESEMEKCYEALTKIVGNYAATTGIDLVLSHTSVVFAKSELDLTNIIKSELKTLDLYSEEEVLEEQD